MNVHKFMALVFVSVARLCLAGCGDVYHPYPAGDTNRDCIVNELDLFTLADQWLSTNCIYTDWCSGIDFNKSGQVDFNDYCPIANNWLFDSAPYDTVLINEIVAINKNGLVDEDGNQPDWLELYNPNSKAVNLNNWYLTDDPAILNKWQFPDVNIPSGGYMVVFASDKNRSMAGAPLHLNFKLDGDGEYLALIEPGLKVAYEYSPKFPKQSTDKAYGIGYPTGELGLLETPTPGARNSGITLLGNVADTKFSINRGFYTVPFDLIITTATSGASIYYTLDGSAPSPSRGTLYIGPIHISTTSVVKAAAFKTGWRPTNVDTQTYLFLGNVLSQTRPPAYPEIWGLDKYGRPVIGDYDMDPEVAAAYPSLVNDLKAVPTLAIGIDINDMFGPTGLYPNSLEDGNEWERSCSVEYFKPDSNDGFHLNCGIRIHGGQSRLVAYRKHSFRLYFKSMYGPSKLNYKLFDDSDVDKFDTVVLRACYNNTWLRGDSVDRQQAQYCRDQFARQCQLDMGWLSPHGRYVHLYINGLYWGVYNLVERPEASFAASYLGGDKEEYDALNSGDPVDGNTTAWSALKSIYASSKLTADQKYIQVQQYVDLDNFIDYMLFNFYLGNRDWPDRNWYAVRKRAPGAHWYFFSWDAEDTLEDVNEDRTATSEGSPGAMYNYLRPSSEFCLRFADRAQKFLFGDGVLTPANSVQRYTQVSSLIYDAIVGESARWGDALRSTPYTRDVHWIPERQRIVTNYLPQRTEIFINQLRAAGLYPDVSAPQFSRNQGPVPSGTSVAITNTMGDGTIIYTLDGSEPRTSGQVYSDPVIITSYTHIKCRINYEGTYSALVEGVFYPD